MIDIVIPLGKSKIKHLDLRYCLRSIEANVKNYRDVWIIGDLPSWIRNVKHIGYSDDPDKRYKERNILRKFQAASLNHNVSEKFLATNDDIFFLDEVDAENYPYFYGGTWTESWINNKSTYRATANHTLRWLEARGFSDNNFDCHCPILYDKAKFLKSFNDFDFDTAYGYGIKTLYCAVNRIKGEHMPDLKLKKKYTLREVEMRCQGRHVVSCTDVPIKYALGDYLHEMFPKKSKFEV